MTLQVEALLKHADKNINLSISTEYREMIQICSDK